MRFKLQMEESQSMEKLRSLSCFEVKAFALSHSSTCFNLVFLCVLPFTREILYNYPIGKSQCI
jgi:hypothetical protein